MKVHKKRRGWSFLWKRRVRTEKGAVLGMRGPGVPGRGSQACDPNSQSSRPFSLYQFIYLFIYYFPSQNFQVGGLAIIHKRNEPNLARFLWSKNGER
jgi:hypothetical protein